MKRYIAVLAILIVTCVCFCSCAKSEIVGKWAQSSDGLGTTLQFNEDGTGSLIEDGKTTYNCTYSIKGKIITIITTIDNREVENQYSFKFVRNELVLTRENNDRIVLMKQENKEK